MPVRSFPWGALVCGGCAAPGLGALGAELKGADGTLTLCGFARAARPLCPNRLNTEVSGSQGFLRFLVVIRGAACSHSELRYAPLGGTTGGVAPREAGFFDA